MRLALMVPAVLALASSAAAQPYLNGGLVYIAGSSDGSNAGGAYEFDSFDTGNADLRFNGVSKTPMLLSPGDNVFAFDVDGGFGSPSPCGLALFFTDDSTLLNTFGLAPDLAAYRVNGTFAFASPGVLVPTLGASSPVTAYSGATEFQSGLFKVTLTSFTFSGLAGSITLNVSTIPTPGAAAVLGLGVLGVSRRRR